MKPITYLGLLAVTLLFVAAAQASDSTPTILFIRGAERSGGFLEADDDAERTEQLADNF